MEDNEDEGRGPAAWRGNLKDERVQRLTVSCNSTRGEDRIQPSRKERSMGNHPETGRC